jgi:hypothetical protein
MRCADSFAARQSLRQHPLSLRPDLDAGRMAQSMKSLGRGKVLTVKEIDHPQLIRVNGRRFARYVRLHSAS